MGRQLITGPVKEAPEVDSRHSARSDHQIKLAAQSSSKVEANRSFSVGRSSRKKVYSKKMDLDRGCPMWLLFNFVLLLLSPPLCCVFFLRCTSPAHRSPNQTRTNKKARPSTSSALNLEWAMKRAERAERAKPGEAGRSPHTKKGESNWLNYFGLRVIVHGLRMCGSRSAVVPRVSRTCSCDS